ncbi:peptide-methionine (S)-S-oxide reductase MsrA [Membranihabitans marinus]|uniref:peptide-methionine (S)-S-oxide reductase MsrA n=1 Tax=Membranihabitans marinus TaxID=1227546 RepID=UPI001F001DFF|nr:peptide-methionine (S)-S-oxide reductase MsrA [Membranihabitans marinus]
MENIQIATFGGGCFWCVEAVIQRLKGVQKIEPGYAAGKTANPTYKEVCSGLTGHAEVIQVHFDADTISYRDLLTIFMTSHDPTTLNRQGGDVGTQYRSIILFHNPSQHKTALSVIDEVQPTYPDPIVTELQPLEVFYPAEQYHYDYFNNNGSARYCQVVINPKVNKLKEKYKSFLKEEEIQS